MFLVSFLTTGGKNFPVQFFHKAGKTFRNSIAGERRQEARIELNPPADLLRRDSGALAINLSLIPTFFCGSPEFWHSA
jgi:hypothetical protein